MAERPFLGPIGSGLIEAMALNRILRQVERPFWGQLAPASLKLWGEYCQM